MILNGVDIHNSKKTKKKFIIKSIGITAYIHIIGMVGNLKRVKNHLFLLQAFYELKKEIDGVKLLLIGQGFSDDPDNTEPEIRSFIDKHGLNDSVLLLGYRSDVNELLQIMDVFCLSSLKEGLPISIIEAMAAGVPVIGSDVEGINDVIEHGKTGILVPLNDIQKLKTGLLTLLNDERLRQNLISEAKIKVVEKYSMEGCIKNYHDLFLNLYENRKVNMIKNTV